MESVIELQRSAHEENERVELAIVEEYKNVPKTVSFLPLLLCGL